MSAVEPAKLEQLSNLGEELGVGAGDPKEMRKVHFSDEVRLDVGLGVSPQVLRDGLRLVGP